MDGTNPETEHSVADLLVLTFVAPPPRGKVAQRISLKLSGVPRPSALISLQPPSRISPLSHITLASIILWRFHLDSAILYHIPPHPRYKQLFLSCWVFFFLLWYYPLNTSLSALSPIVHDNPANLRTPLISPFYSRLFSPSRHSSRGVHQRIPPIWGTIKCTFSFRRIKNSKGMLFFFF